MATAAITSDTRVQWMWNSSENPFSKADPIEWSPYSDIENIIIEEIFQTGESYVELDDYYINLKDKMQISKKDDTKQRPIKRMERNKDDIHVREERFTYKPISPTRPFAGLYGWISPFIRATAYYLNITRKQLPSKDNTTLTMIVEKAALGIREEGRSLGKPVQAEKLYHILVETKNASMADVWKCCARLYTMESFLYKKLNETLRLIGSEQHEEVWRKKVPTLGPFCLLLWDNPFKTTTTEKGTILYRGAKLSAEEIASFKVDCSKELQADCAKKSRRPHLSRLFTSSNRRREHAERSKGSSRSFQSSTSDSPKPQPAKRPEGPLCSFQSFTSCSRKRERAERFGNVLFIMTVKQAFTVDLKPFSDYPYEEEELISPGICFTVDRIEFDEQKNKHIIYLDLSQQYRRKLRYSI